jgi:hypothetical protein
MHDARCVATGFYIMNCLCIMYFDIFYIQWHHLAKEDLWNKIYILFYYIQVYRNSHFSETGSPSTEDRKESLLCWASQYSCIQKREPCSVAMKRYMYIL